MRKLIATMIAGIIVVSSVGCGTTYIEPGNVGVRVNMYGSKKGVEDKPLSNGRYWYNPFTTQIYEFPTFEQNTVWTQSITEGSPTDESFSFGDKNGVQVNVDLGCQYVFHENKVPHLFTRLRRDAHYIGHNYIRNQIRDQLTREARKLDVMEIFGSQGSSMLDKIRENVNLEYNDIGIEVRMVAFISEFRVDLRIKESITNTIAAKQQAIAAENKVQQIKAEAEQAIERARGESESKLVMAQKEAEANEVLTKSLSPELLQYKAMDKWDGKLPIVSGSGVTPFINLGTK